MPMLLGIERQTERRAKRTAENSDPRSNPPVDLGLLDLGESNSVGNRTEMPILNIGPH